MFNTLSRRYLENTYTDKICSPSHQHSPINHYLVSMLSQKKPNPLIIEYPKEDGYNISQVFLSTVKIA